MRTATYSSHWPRSDAFSKHQKNRLNVAVVNEDGGKLKATWKWGLEESAEVRMIPRQSKGIQEIIRMMFDVQNGTVHKSASVICHVRVRTWNARK